MERDNRVHYTPEDNRKMVQDLLEAHNLVVRTDLFTDEYYSGLHYDRLYELTARVVGKKRFRHALEQVAPNKHDYFGIYTMEKVAELETRPPKKKKLVLTWSDHLNEELQKYKGYVIGAEQELAAVKKQAEKLQAYVDAGEIGLAAFKAETEKERQEAKEIARQEDAAEMKAIEKKKKMFEANKALMKTIAKK
jgi:hypothetical protein